MSYLTPIDLDILTSLSRPLYISPLLSCLLPLLCVDPCSCPTVPMGALYTPYPCSNTPHQSPSRLGAPFPPGTLTSHMGCAAFAWAKTPSPPSTWPWILRAGPPYPGHLLFILSELWNPTWVSVAIYPLQSMDILLAFWTDYSRGKRVERKRKEGMFQVFCSVYKAHPCPVSCK